MNLSFERALCLRCSSARGLDDKAADKLKKRPAALTEQGSLLPLVSIIPLLSYCFFCCHCDRFWLLW